MAKYFGKIGYANTKETSLGIWENEIETREYYGDVLENNQRYNLADKINEDINISNKISIIADAYANDNFDKMAYVEFKGIKWKIRDINISYPRLIISLGGLYVEQER